MNNNSRAIEYQMTKTAFNAILETRNEAEKKLNPYDYVMNVINTEYGLRGTVKHIAIFDDV